MASDFVEEPPEPNPLRWTYLWFFGIAPFVNGLVGLGSGLDGLGSFAICIAFVIGGSQHLRSPGGLTPSGLRAEKQPVRYYLVAAAWFILALGALVGWRPIGGLIAAWA